MAWFLERHRPDLLLPSRNTLHNLLHRAELVPKRRPRMRHCHPGRPTAEAAEPNTIWTTDFKGQFRTCDDRYCFPLNVQDMHSRFLLSCQGLPDVSSAGADPVFMRLFREFGLPERIRSVDGARFAANPLGRLSRLSVCSSDSASRPSLWSPRARTRTASTRTCTWSSSPRLRVRPA